MSSIGPSVSTSFDDTSSNSSITPTSSDKSAKAARKKYSDNYPELAKKIEAIFQQKLEIDIAALVARATASMRSIDRYNPEEMEAEMEKYS